MSAPPRTLHIDATLLGDLAMERALADIAGDILLAGDDDGIEWDLPPTEIHATGLAGHGIGWSWDAPASYTVTHERRLWDQRKKSTYFCTIRLHAVLDTTHDPRSDGVAVYDVREA